jgi:sugar O-acyltransferase (sialic acid O-acetyltransferase NeuD family)
MTLRRKDRRLVIFGTEEYSEIAFEYFQKDSRYEVVGFTADKAYLTADSQFGLLVVPFEDVDKHFPPGDHDLFAAVVYAKLNRVREDVCARAKSKGYRLASYVSSRSFVWSNVKIGEHCFIFEDNTIQPFACIGNNVVLWSGNHVGHHSRIGDHVFVSSHVVISGHVEIGEHCFVGVNSTFANNTRLGKGSWVSHGAILSGDIPPHSLVKSVASEVTVLNEAALLRALDRFGKRRAGS